MVYGVNVWWHSTADNYVFQDGTNDPEYHLEGPALLHYRNANVESVCARSELCWSDVIKKEIKIPATVIRLYDQDGNPTLSAVKAWVTYGQGLIIFMNLFLW